MDELPRSEEAMRKKNETKCARGIFPIAVMLLMLSSCGAPYHGGGTVRGQSAGGVKIAILPFENLSAQEGAGKMAGSLFLVKMLGSGVFEISDPGVVEEALGEERVRLTSHIRLDILKKLGEHMGVKYILVGTVLENEMQMLGGVSGGGQVPSVSVTARIVDVTSGRVMWADARARRGTDSEKIFGIGRIYSTTKIMNVILEEMVSSMEQAFEQKDLGD